MKVESHESQTVPSRGTQELFTKFRTEPTLKLSSFRGRAVQRKRPMTLNGVWGVSVFHSYTSTSMRNTHSICHNLRMCGRYRLSRRKQVIDEHFDSISGEEDWSQRYNVAPTQPVPVIRQHPKEPVRELWLMKWGLIPSWAKDPSGAASMINARSETAATKPAFRDALKSRRCLIPADGFYEWAKTGKQPYCFEVNGGKLFAFAGVWDRWKDPSGTWVKSCSILTTAPNAVTSPVH